MTPTPKIAVAVVRSSIGKTSKRIAWAVEMSAPPPMPWTIRHPTSDSREWALPHINEPKGNGRAMLVTGSARGDRHHRGHPGAERVGGILARIHGDADRHPLHDLGEVAGRVVGRQQREPRARRGAQALHPAGELDAGIGVHL